MLNLSSREMSLKEGYRPFGALFGSVVFHSLALCGLFVLSLIGPTIKPPVLEPAVMINLKELRDVTYLPILPILTPQAIQQSEGAPSEPEPARPGAGAGLSYPGPQPILSDFPNPTNRIQTVLQPALANPRTLEPPLLLPNIVRMNTLRPTGLEPPLQALRPPDAFASVAPGPAPAPVQPSKLTMVNQPELIAAPPAPVAPVKPLEEAKVEPPRMAPPRLSLNTPDVEDLLILSPTPAVSAAVVPAGEARGRFAISPQPNLAASGSEPSLGVGNGESARENGTGSTARTSGTANGVPAGAEKSTSNTGGTGNGSRETTG